MPLNVFRLYSALLGESKPDFPIVTGISANCIYCSQRNVDRWSLFIFHLFRVTLLFAIYLFAFCLSQFGLGIADLFFLAFVFFYIYISTIIFRPWRLSFCRNLFLYYLLDVFISYHSLAIIDVVGFTLVTSPIFVASFSPWSAARVLLHFRARCRALSIGSANYERRMERFEDSESVITMFTVIIRFRHNY